MFVVMRIQGFDVEPAPNQRLVFPFPITIDKGMMVGFLPVYETREAALAEFPDAPLTEVRIITKRD